MLKNRLTLLIHSCDKFSDLWDAHIYLLNKIYYYCLVGGSSMQRNMGFVRIFWRITMKRSYSRFNEYGA